MNILFLSQGYPPHSNGGIAKLTQCLAEGLALKGHTVWVIAKSNNGPSHIVRKGVNLHFITQEWHPEIQLSIAKGLAQTVIDYSYSAYLKILEISKSVQLDIVSAPIWDHEGIFCLLDKHLRTVISLHTTYKISLPFNHRWTSDSKYMLGHIDKMIAMEDYVMENCSYILANSEAILDQTVAKKRSDLTKLKFTIIPHGTADYFSNENSFVQPKTETRIVRILFVGRLEKRKGADILFQSINKITHKSNTLYFDIVGEDSIDHQSGRYFSQLIDKELIDSGRVALHGIVSEKNLKKFYNSSDVLVVPSRYESFGLVAIEGMSAGLPIIAGNQGGLSEVIVEGKNGIFIDPESSDELSEAILKLSSSIGLRTLFSSNSREIFKEKFRIETMVQKHEEFYKSILQND